MVKELCPYKEEPRECIGTLCRVWNKVAQECSHVLSDKEKEVRKK